MEIESPRKKGAQRKKGEKEVLGGKKTREREMMVRG